MSYKSFAPPAATASTTQLYIYSTIAFALIPILSALAVSYVYCPSGTSVRAHPVCLPSFDTASIRRALMGNGLTVQDGWVSTFCKDQHYRYLVPLLVPVTAWFAIANWVGWEYFRFS